MASTQTQRRTKPNFLYGTYYFRKDEQDPACQQVVSIIHDHDMKLSRISNASNVSPAAIGNWLNGKTKRPQHATMAAVLGFFGYEFEITQKRRNEAKEGQRIEAHSPKVVKRFRANGNGHA